MYTSVTEGNIQLSFLAFGQLFRSISAFCWQALRQQIEYPLEVRSWGYRAEQRSIDTLFEHTQVIYMLFNLVLFDVTNMR